jgi:predicted DNA-binding transcriptional regulator AlpA
MDEKRHDDDIDTDELLGQREICRLENISRSTLYNRVARGTFPPPIPNPGGREPNKWRRSIYRAYRKQRFSQSEKQAA